MNDPSDTKTPTAPPPGPPGSWEPARRLAKRAYAPVERFLQIEASSGILLLAAAALALLWANSPWRDSYTALWHTPIGFSFGSFAFERDLHFWINDGVMTIFFFVAGLEIRREIHRGELSELRRAALPLAAALGGMVVPALIYVALNRGHSSVGGWGIPMATDIAFAVGALTLLGNRVPPALRILLLALAVIDDVGAILVIAFFYSTGFVPLGFLIMAIGILLILGLQAFGVRSPWIYVPAGVVVWAGAYAAGIHPTLAGVLVGLLTPVHAWFGSEGFFQRAERSIAALRAQHGAGGHDLHAQLDSLAEARREAVPPVERLLHALHGWVAYAIMPLFALANAGVSMGQAAFSGEPLLVFLGVSLGLLLGKPIGIVLFSWLATRLGLAALPRGMTWAQLGVMGTVAGIGFTMSIFVAGLAFPPGANMETAKVGILLGSGLAGVLAYGMGRLVLTGVPAPGAARTASEAEASTEA